MIQPITFITMSTDRDSLAEISAALSANNRTRLLSSCDNTDQLYTDVMRLQPLAVVMTLGEHIEQTFGLIKRLTASAPNTAVIVAARDASPSLILSSLRTGAREFLQLPLKGTEFTTVLDRVAEFCAEHVTTHKKKGKVVAVYSSKGGTGISFIATNIAAAMKSPTLLADLNLQAGDLDSMLGLVPKHSISEMVSNRQRLDDVLIGSYVTPHSAHLSLLAAPLEAHESEDIKPEHIFEVMHVLRERYDLIVLDLQHTLDPVTVAALDYADDVLLVLTLDIPGIRSAKRALKIFERIGFPRGKVHIIINRWSKQIEVELKKVELHLGGPAVGLIPNDYRKVMDSINLGQPLVQTDPASRIATEIKRLATVFSGRGVPPSEQPRRGLLKSMFSRQTAPSALELGTTLD